MSDTTKLTNTSTESTSEFTSKGSRKESRPMKGHPAILRVSSLIVAALLSLLMLTAVVPPIVADQSDRAVVNAPLTLLTAPVEGIIDVLSAVPGREMHPGESLARISNSRLDRSTLISLESKAADVREKLEATRGKRASDREYVDALDHEIAIQADQLKAQFESQIVELRARVAESDALSGEKKALVDRQTKMVARDAASMDMLRPTTQQYSAALHKTDAEKAKLDQKVAQLDALKKGIYVGDDLVAIGTLAQKRRDIDLDARRMEIEEKELSAVYADQRRLMEDERKRLEMLAGADVLVPTRGKILAVGAAPGRHVNAGDSVASLVDCDKRFVVAIFSYHQGQSMKVGTRVRVDGAGFGTGIVTAVLPKTSDKVDELFAVPFPQTERRELYAIITPEGRGDGGAIPETVAHTEQSSSCSVGQWVTVTEENGMVPSMSVTWRNLEMFVSSWGERPWGIRSWGDKNRPLPSIEDKERKHQAGVDALSAAFRSQGHNQPSRMTDWAPRTDAVVSR